MERSDFGRVDVIGVAATLFRFWWVVAGLTLALIAWLVHSVAAGLG